MAETLLHHRPQESCYPANAFPRQELAPLSNFQARLEIQQHDQHLEREAMAQSLMQRPFRLGPPTDNNFWSGERNLAQHAELQRPEAATGACHNKRTTGQHSWWDGVRTMNSAVEWNTGLPNEPCVLTDLNPPSGAHGAFGFEGLGAQQDTIGKDDYEPSWPLSTMGSLSHQVSVFQGSESDTNTSSTSPKSFLSDLTDVEYPLTPAPTSNQISPNGTWTCIEGKLQCNAESLPVYKINPALHRFPETAPQPGHATTIVGPSSLRQVTLGVSLSPVQGLQVPSSRDMVEGSTLVAQRSGVDWVNAYTHNQMEQWQTVSYSGDLTASPYFPKSQGTVPRFALNTDGLPSCYEGQSPANAALRPCGQEVEAHCIVPTQSNPQDDRSDESQAQRKIEDDILLEGKAAGLTYKEIRKKMRTKVAESTLRGRYRSLTKARKDRVRKPMWTDQDIRLLKHIVRLEFSRIDDSYRTSNRDQLMTKVSWKKVAEYIAEHGGSYHFGNSTCKKKWIELDMGH